MRHRQAALGAIVLAAVALPAAAAVKDSAASGFTIENSVIVPVEPAVAWRGLVDDVGRWWPSDHTWWGDASRLSIEPRAGGCFCERAGAQQAMHLLVTFVDPGRMLRLTGGLGPLQGMGLHGALEFRFEPAGAGRTEITLRYRAGGYTPDDLSAFAPVVDRVQAQQLGGLAKHLGGPVPAPADAVERAPRDGTSDAPVDGRPTPSVHGAGGKLPPPSLQVSYSSAAPRTMSSTQYAVVAPRDAFVAGHRRRRDARGTLV